MTELQKLSTAQHLMQKHFAGTARKCVILWHFQCSFRKMNQQPEIGVLAMSK
jgi:hypothetical protein